MTLNERAVWLVSNPYAGSNDAKALAALEHACGDHGFAIARRTILADQPLPVPAMLDAAGIGLVAVFAGDGTINSLIAGLRGWSGAVIVLPGGTMNLLYRRLHGARTMEQAIGAIAGGNAALVRPSVIRTPHRDAFAGVLAGPGASWGRVREAMRVHHVVELAATTIQAIEETLTGEMIACLEPPLGRREGYPLLSLTPRESVFEVEAYHAETAGEYLAQAWALLRREFRDGPHDKLGEVRSLRLGSTQGNPFGLLVDGEEAAAGAELEVVLAHCDVDLVATEPDHG